MMTKISWKAVIASSIFNFALMTLLIIGLGALYGRVFHGAGGGPATPEDFINSWFAWLAFLAPIPAGYLAASIAKREAVLHGALASSLNVLWGFFCLIFLAPFLVSGLATIAANIALAAFGGHLWLKVHNR
jgi:hypothetical protein